MEYILAMTFLTSTGVKSTISISGVKPNLTDGEAKTLMDTIIAKDIFLVDSGSFISKDSAKLTQRQVTKYELA